MATSTTTPDVKSAGLPTLHHLNNSQSQRILWLLEELGIEYNLVLHVRDKGHRAPPEMKDIQELGRAPILVAADGRVIIESSTIVIYLLRTYDKAGKFSTEDWIRDETLTSFTGATLGPLNTIELLFNIAAKHTPWPFVYLSRAMRNAVQKNFTTPEFKKNLDYLEKEMGDKEWFNGANLGKSDILLSWPFDMIAQRRWVDLEKQYPKLSAWRKRIEARDAWKRGLEKGNGYDLATW